MEQQFHKERMRSGNSKARARPYAEDQSKLKGRKIQHVLKEMKAGTKMKSERTNEQANKRPRVKKYQPSYVLFLFLHSH